MQSSRWRSGFACLAILWACDGAGGGAAGGGARADLGDDASGGGRGTDSGALDGRTGMLDVAAPHRDGPGSVPDARPADARMGDASDGSAPSGDRGGADALPQACLRDEDCAEAPGAGEPCRVGRCQEGTCAVLDAAEGEACDDGLECTSGDRCVVPACDADAGPCERAACLGATTDDRACDDGNACTADACAPGTGCTHAAQDGPCDDGDACTIGDACAAGTCVPGGGPEDCDDDHVCTDDACDPLLGCRYDDNTEPCDDADACTEGDTCRDGACIGDQPTDCADGNPCTDDLCDPSGGCLNPNNVLPCEDGDACTIDERCDEGACVPGGPRTCDDGDPCTRDVCDRVNGCGTVDDGGVCNDGNACTEDLCAGAGDCRHVLHEGPCDDGNACTGEGRCAGGACLGGPAVDCDDDNPCTADGCDPALGCTHLPAEGGCNDADRCTVGERCADGACLPRSRLDCDDGNPCTDDLCDPLEGCRHVPNAARCDDGDACTEGDACAGGLCVAGGPADCDDVNPCTDDACDRARGCTNAPNAGPCDDGDACTLDEACAGGECLPVETVDCDDDDPCTDDACDPVGGCVHEDNEAPCDDGDACTDDDRCAAGTCGQGAPRDCDDDNPCTDDACDPREGCRTVPNRADCDDGDACTPGDACANGVCVRGQTVPCDVDCTVGVDCEPRGYRFVQPTSCGSFCYHDELHPADRGAVGHGQLDNGIRGVDDALADLGRGAAYEWAGWQERDVDVDFVFPRRRALGLVSIGVSNGCCGIGAPVAIDVSFSDDGATFGGTRRFRVADGSLEAVPPGRRADLTLDLTGHTARWVRLHFARNAEWIFLDEVLFGPPPGAVQCSRPAGCDAATGRCERVPAADGAPCWTGDACVTGEVCRGGACVGGGPRSCGDDEQCTGDVCDRFRGCVNDVELGACDDGDLCTVDDSCGPDGCRGRPRRCGQVCDGASCDPVGYATPNEPDCGTWCYDDEVREADLAELGPGQLTDGVRGTDRFVEDLGQGPAYEWVGWFNEVVELTFAFEAPRTFSTVSVGLSNECCGIAGPNAIEVELADEPGAFAAPRRYSVADGTLAVVPPGGRGDVVLDVSGGAGRYVRLRFFAPGVFLFLDEIEFGPQAAGAQCLLRQACDPATGACVTERREDGTACDDGDACTTGEACRAGACDGAQPLDCDDRNPCTDDACDPAAGCRHTPNEAPCDDGSACTVGDRCLDGACRSGPGPDCDDEDPCTDDVCVPGGGCAHPFNEAPCDDGNLCTRHDQCSEGVCAPGVPLPCGDACQIGVNCETLGYATQDVVGVPACGCYLDDGHDPDDAVLSQGQLTDGARGGDDFAADLGQGPGFEWVGYLHEDFEIDFAFPVRRPFSTVTLGISNGCCDIVPPDAVAVSVSDDRVHFGAPITFRRADGTLPAVPRGTRRDLRLDVTGLAGRYLRLRVLSSFGGRPGAVMLDEVAFGPPPPEGQCREPAACDPRTGLCLGFPLRDGTACDDGDACTHGDVCLGGVCRAIVETCDDDSKCTSDRCDRVLGCVHAVAQVCGDGLVDRQCGEVCDDGNRSDDDACPSDCSRPATCGDGAVQPGLGETCDDGPGNRDDLPDACRTDCRRARCGDGVLDRHEGCDAGPANSAERPGACRPWCMPAGCGDQVTDPGEACDDGNLEDEDGCDAQCRVERCADGVVQARLGETCDDANRVAGDGCDAGCQRESCGDFVVQANLSPGANVPGERCDDGPNGSAACTPDCQPRVCGEETCNGLDDDCDLAIDEGCSPNNAEYGVLAGGPGQAAPAVRVKRLPPHCDSAFDCNDENIFTTDACTNGVCSWTFLACDGPDPDMCNDGRTLGSNLPCLDRGPRLLWDFDIASAVAGEGGKRITGTVADTSAENRTGVLDARNAQGPATPMLGAPARFGARALQLTAAQSAHAYRTMALEKSDFTLSAWFRTRAARGGIFAAVGSDAVAQEHTVCGVTTRDGYLGHSAVGDPLTPTDREVYLQNGKLAYRVAPGGSSRCTGQGPAVNDGQWHMATLMCRKDRHCRLYLDGNVLCESNPNDTVSSLPYQHQLAVGWSQLGGFLEGSVDQVAYFDHPMGPEEIADLHAGLTRPEDGDNLERCDGSDNDCDGLVDESCDDGDPRTTGEACQVGVCRAPPIAACPPAPCLNVFRDPVSGACRREVDPARTGQVCDDGLACTSGDRCDAAGFCVGTIVADCGDGRDRAFFDPGDPNTVLVNLARSSNVLTAFTPAIDPNAGLQGWRPVAGAPDTWRYVGATWIRNKYFDHERDLYALAAGNLGTIGEIVVGLGEPFTLGGTVGLPWTTSGFFGELGVPGVELPTLAFGYAPGASLHSLGAPLKDDVNYMYLRGAAQLGVTFPNAPTIPLFGPSLTAVVDSTDPLVYLSLIGDMPFGAADANNPPSANGSGHWSKSGDILPTVHLKAGAIGFSLGGNLRHRSHLDVWDGRAFIPAVNDAHVYIKGSVAFTPTQGMAIGATGTFSLNYDPRRDGYDPHSAALQTTNRVLADDWAAADRDRADFKMMMEAGIDWVLGPIRGPGGQLLRNPLTGQPIYFPLRLANAVLLVDVQPQVTNIYIRGKTQDMPWKFIPGLSELFEQTCSDVELDVNAFISIPVAGNPTWGMSLSLNAGVPIGPDGVGFRGVFQIGTSGTRFDGKLALGDVVINPTFNLGTVDLALSWDGEKLCSERTLPAPAVIVEPGRADKQTTCEIKVCIGKNGLHGSEVHCQPFCMANAECPAGQACLFGICAPPAANGSPCTQNAGCASNRCFAGSCVECWPGQEDCGGDSFCDNAGYCQDKLDTGEPCVAVFGGGEVMRNDWCRSGKCDTTCVDCWSPNLLNVVRGKIDPLFRAFDCPEGQICSDFGLCIPQRTPGQSCYSLGAVTGLDSWCSTDSCGDPAWTCRSCNALDHEGRALTCSTRDAQGRLTEWCDDAPVVGSNTCRPKVADGVACTDAEVCLNGACSLLTGCYTPRSKPYGAACSLQDECQSGQCVVVGAGVVGYCGCNGDAARCPQGQVCLAGTTCGPPPPVCGDGACNGADTCLTCPQDCGQCCGNGRCEAGFGETCATCNDCACGNGFRCTAGVCEALPVCGDGRCNGADTCATCPQDCGRCCGNGVCEAGFGETCESCGDCACAAGFGCTAGVCNALPRCGDGACNGVDTCATCPGDCGNCCGNGACEAGFGESCGTCPADCGVCPACGDGRCNGAETCIWCPADCGRCFGASCGANSDCESGHCNAGPGYDCGCSTCYVLGIPFNCRCSTCRDYTCGL